MHGLLLPILLCLSLLVATTNGVGDGRIYIYDCPGNTSYTPGSAFRANLDVLLASLPGAAAASTAAGFAKNATGAAPDRAYGLAQCRGDVNASECRACLDASVRDVASKCHGQRSAMVIYEACQLLYSDESFFAVFNKTFSFHSCDETWYMPHRFNDQLFYLILNLTEKAAYGSPRMFAVGAVQATPSLKLYAMAQCARDITADDCDRCLSSVGWASPFNCVRKQSIWFFRRSCSIRIEVYEFYKAQAVGAPMSSAPAPA